ncbi:MAG TPA: winged helix-turn-helix domain-containing protein [Pyrinomonadaceae bacterium]|jgi:DNA-binding response OmpR family regulator|nr:winged helix-turn-helix domain-containing protein [Pyrinomonadaceae bacterium]
MNEKDVKTLHPGGATSPPVRTLRAGAIEINLQRSNVTVHGKPIKLTTKEFELLRELMETRGEVLSREFLLEKIWGYGKASEVDSRTIDVHIQRLRQKLGAEGGHILTVKNVGYRFDIFYNWIKFGA